MHTVDEKDSVITKDVVRPIYLVKSLVTATEPMTAQSLLAENIPPMSSTGHSLLRNIPAIPNIEQKTHTGRAVAIMSSSVNTAVSTDHSLQDEKQHNLFCKNTPLTTLTHFHMDGSDRIEIKSHLDEDIPPVPSTCHPPLQNIPAIPNTEQKTRRAVDILPGSVTAPALTDHSLQEEKQGQLFSNPSSQTFPTEDGDTSLRNELALYNNFELFKLEPVGDQKCLLKRVVNQDMRVQFKNAYGNFISAKTNIFSENEIDQTADIEQIVDAKDTLSDVIINYSVETETTASPPTTNKFDVNAIPLSEEVSKPVSCPYCLETFRHDQSFSDHLYLHISDAAYKDTVKCEVCGKRNDSRIALLEHMHVHTNFKLYSCTVCSKKFAYGQSFKDHMRIHSGRKNMKCSLCGEFFNTYYNLRHHRRTQHGLEKVICKKTQKICEYCGRQFKWRSTLLSHYNSHSEIPKSHLCSVCGKGFATAHSLSNHCGKHRAESKPKQPSVCHICGSSFTNRGGLYQHMKNIHNDMKS